MQIAVKFDSCCLCAFPQSCKFQKLHFRCEIWFSFIFTSSTCSEIATTVWRCL